MNLKQLFLPFLVVLLFVGCTSTDDGAITAAGVVEAVQVAIAPEVSGRVVEVFVDEGDAVGVGDPLFRIEDEATAAQRNQALAALGAAEAGLETAKAGVTAVASSMTAAEAGVAAAEAEAAVAETAVGAAQAALESALAGVEIAEVQYQAALAAARTETQPARALSWEQTLADEFSTPPWYFQSEEAVDAAEAEAMAAGEALDVERERFETLMEDGRYAEFHAAEMRIAAAQAAFLVADQLRDKEIAQTGGAEIDAYVQELYEAALDELEAAQEAYDLLADSEAAIEVLEARGRLATATERYELALDRALGLMTGEESFGVRAAGAALRLAEAGVTQAESGVAQAEAMADAAATAVTLAESSKDQIEAGVAQAETAVVQAEKMVEQAQAALDLVDIQMEKLTVKTAVEGAIMTRSVEVGELARAGMTALSVGQLDDLRVTVYIPESKYGQISVGDHAQLTADSFPDQTFDAVVVRIADEAEFTPRNVQTKEERQTTVYAIELSVTDSDGSLKPGMPVDVEFGK